jgi:hypothetical protein
MRRGAAAEGRYALPCCGSNGVQKLPMGVGAQQIRALQVAVPKYDEDNGLEVAKPKLPDDDRRAARRLRPQRPILAAEAGGRIIFESSLLPELLPLLLSLSLPADDSRVSRSGGGVKILFSGAGVDALPSGVPIMEDDGVVVHVSFGSLLDRASFAGLLSGNGSGLAAAFRTDRSFTSTDFTIALHFPFSLFFCFAFSLSRCLRLCFRLTLGCAPRPCLP